MEEAIIFHINGRVKTLGYRLLPRLIIFVVYTFSKNCVGSPRILGGKGIEFYDIGGGGGGGGILKIELG